MKRYLKYICVCAWAYLAFSCRQDAPLDTGADEMVMTYSVGMPMVDGSRVAVDGSKVDDLTVEVFEKDNEEWKSVFRKTDTEKKDGHFTVEVPVMKGRSYKVIFWAQKKDVTAYRTNDLSRISVDYTNYNSGFDAMEDLDAFYFVDEVNDLNSSS